MSLKFNKFVQDQQFNISFDYSSEFYAEKGIHYKVASRNLLQKTNVYVVFLNERYHRGQLKYCDNICDSYTFWLNDLGFKEKVEFKDIFLINWEFYKFPCYIYRGTLHNVKPLNEKWSQESPAMFYSKVSDRLVYAELKIMYRTVSYFFLISCKIS